MIRYINGDLFASVNLFLKENPNFDVLIPHIVNNVGAWGSGFVVPLGRNYPQSRLSYLENHSKYSLGGVQYVKCTDRVTVANMFAQNGIISHSNPTPIRYDALSQCLENIADKILSKSVVHAPKFGSGLAGGDWNEIEKLINKYLQGEVYVYSL